MNTIKNISKAITCLITFMLMTSQIAGAKSFIKMPWHSPDQIQIKTKLSQTKLVQNGANTVFMDITFIPPAVNNISQQQRATDMIIVLDRSGSMSEAKKISYAKAAIWDVLGRLNNNDRFALVSFANNAIVQSPLVHVTASNRSYLNNVVSSINAAGGTNMGEGLNAALNLLANNRSERARKILLLSDGQANQGITNPEQLAQLATRATQYGAVLSSIGMGLGFNETLMAKLADHGMGHYYYLEDLSGLGAILARDLSDTRNIYANSSTLEMVLGGGVKLIDAGGYPISHTGSSTVQVTTGQMLANTPKHFVMSFNVPTAHVGTVSLGSMRLNYQVNGEQLQFMVNAEELVLAVVAPEFRIQAQQSIDKDVYQNSWVENNLGRMKKTVSKWLREGKKDKAKQAINEYRAEVKAASVESNIVLATPVVKSKLDAMEKEVDDAFDGSLLDQQVKRNRSAKSMQYDSINTQRK